MKKALKELTIMIILEAIFQYLLRTYKALYFKSFLFRQKLYAPDAGVKEN